MSTDNKSDTPAAVPLFHETMAGALIDSARISVMAALSLLPPPAAPLIILPGEPEESADDPIASADGCLEQAHAVARRCAPAHDRSGRPGHVAPRRRSEDARMKCIHCGCTEKRACIVTLDEQPQAIRSRIRMVCRRQRLAVPTKIGCSWISENPPVCSAPACRKKHAEVTA